MKRDQRIEEELFPFYALHALTDEERAEVDAYIAVNPEAAARLAALAQDAAGLALMATLAKICVARGYGRFEWSVLDWNQPAIRFYESVGAAPLADWTRWRVTGPALTALAGGGAPGASLP